MDAADAFWHLTNYLAPPVVMGAFAAVLAKLLWRREIGRGSALRLWGWASAASAVASIGGLVVFGQDGRMATYAAMVLACALALWWAAFPGGKR